MNVHILSSVTCSDNFLVRPNPNSQKAFLIHSFNHQLKTINLFVSPSCSIWEFEESVTCFFFPLRFFFFRFSKKIGYRFEINIELLLFACLEIRFFINSYYICIPLFRFFIVLCKLLFYFSLKLLYVYRWNTKKMLCYE